MWLAPIGCREIGELDIIDAGQVHLFYTAKLTSDFGAGEESLESALFAPEDIPWDELAFQSVEFALRKYLEDPDAGRGLHMHELRRSNHYRIRNQGAALSRRIRSACADR